MIFLFAWFTVWQSNTKSFSLCKNSSLGFSACLLQIVASCGRLPVATPKLPIFVLPEPKELKYSPLSLSLLNLQHELNVEDLPA